MSPILQHPPPRPPPAAEEEDLSEEEGLDKAVLMTGGGPKHRSLLRKGFFQCCQALKNTISHIRIGRPFAGQGQCRCMAVQLCMHGYLYEDVGAHVFF